MENIDPRLPGTSTQTPRSRRRSSGVVLPAPQPRRSLSEVAGRPSNGAHGIEEGARYTGSVDPREPLSSLTNVDLQSARRSQGLARLLENVQSTDDYYIGMIKACAGYSSDLDSDSEDEDDDDAVPHQNSVSDPTDAVQAQGADDFDDFYAEEEGNYHGPPFSFDEDEDEDEDAQPGRTATTNSEDSLLPASESAGIANALTPSPEAASPPQEAQQVLIAATLATDTQATLESTSIPRVATEEQPPSSGKKGSRKRCLSEVEDQPNKRAASDSRMGANALATSQSRMPPDPITLPGPSSAAVVANAPATETVVASRASSGEIDQGDRSESIIAAVSSVFSEESVPTISSTSPGVVSSDVDADNTTRIPMPSAQLPDSAPPSRANGEIPGQRSAIGTTSHNVLTQTPATLRHVQHIPSTADSVAANAVGPIPAPISVGSASSSLELSAAPTPHTNKGKEPATKKKVATANSKRVGRPPGAKDSRRSKQPIKGTFVFSLTEPLVAAEGAVGRWSYNRYTNYKNVHAAKGWTIKEIDEAYSKLTKDELSYWGHQAELANIKKLAEEQGGQSSRTSGTSSSSSSSTASLDDGSVHVDQAVGSVQQQHQAQASTVQQDTPAHSLHNTNGHSAPQPTVGGSQQYAGINQGPSAAPSHAPASSHHLPNGSPVTYPAAEGGQKSTAACQMPLAPSPNAPGPFNGYMATQRAYQTHPATSSYAPGPSNGYVATRPAAGGSQQYASAYQAHPAASSNAPGPSNGYVATQNGYPVMHYPVGRGTPQYTGARPMSYATPSNGHNAQGIPMAWGPSQLNGQNIPPHLIPQFLAWLSSRGHQHPQPGLQANVYAYANANAAPAQGAITYQHASMMYTHQPLPQGHPHPMHLHPGTQAQGPNGINQTPNGGYTGGSGYNGNPPPPQGQ